MAKYFPAVVWLFCTWLDIMIWVYENSEEINRLTDRKGVDPVVDNVGIPFGVRKAKFHRASL